MEWECCIKSPEQGAKEGVKFITDHIIQVTEQTFDDFAGSDTNQDDINEILGLWFIMKKLFLLIIFLVFSCGDDKYRCGTIDRKYEKDGEYFFALILSDSNGVGEGEDGRVYGDVSVDESVYLIKKIGDDYCVDQ